MPKSTRLLLVAAMIVLAALPAFAKKKELASAPIPAQFLNAKKAFINNVANALDPNPKLTSDVFYTQLKASGLYELTTTPTDADVIFQLRYIEGPILKCEMDVIDPKTGANLWSFSQRIKGGFAEGRRERAVSRILDQLKEVTGKTAAAPAEAANKK